MPTRTGSTSSRDRLRDNENPSYQPGGEYEPWDHDSGSLRLANDRDSHDATFSDQDYNDHLDNGQGYSSRGREQPDREKGGISSSLSHLRNAENDAASGREHSFYTGKGRSSKSSVKGKSNKRKAAVIGVIASLIIGGGAFLGSSNSLLAPAMEALFTEATDTQYASASMRSTHLMRYYLKDTGATATTWTGAKKYTAMSSSFKKRLANQGITIEGSGSNKTLIYTKTGVDGAEVSQRITAADFDNVYRNDVDFRDSYVTAKRGRVATFFDNIANKIYQKLGLSRNLFSKYKQTGNSDVDMKSYKDTMSGKFDNNSSTLSANVEHKKEKPVEVDVKDENGNVIGTKTEMVDATEIYDPSESASTKGNNSVDVAETKARSMINGVADKISQAGGWICAAMRMGNMISIIVAANEIYQSINYFMGLMENVSKMKAGYGDASALNEVLNFMSTPATTQTSELGKLTITSGSGKDAVREAGVLEQTGSPLQSNGMQKILANAPANTSTSKNYSLERVMTSVGAALTTSAATITTCNAVDVASSVISIAVTIGSLGTSTLVQLVGKIALNAAAAAVMGAFFSFLVPTIAKTLFTNVFDTALGIPAGELFTKGASAANTRVGRNGSGQSLSSDIAAAQYNHVNNTVLALDAEIERKNHSPFDISNKNTFFGNIAYNLMPTITNQKSTSVANLLRTTSTSLASIIGRVHAEGEGTSYMTSYGECPNLQSIGAVGDIYCNPVTTTDTSTIDLSPDDATYQDVIKGNLLTGPNTTCDSNGNCTVVDKSNLAKYISFCANRNSPFGVVDQNILGALQVGNSFINSIPVIGDIVSIFDAGISEANIPWANGERCGNTENNSSFWNSEGKYYQRYVEDMRLLENMGAFEETDSNNPVTAYQEKYEKEHPVDDSYEGYIASISGLTKENVESTLAFIEFYQYLDNYDASTRIALEDKTLEESSSSNLIAAWEKGNYPEAQDDIIENPLEIKAIAKQHVVYFDVRNRSYAA